MQSEQVIEWEFVDRSGSGTLQKKTRKVNGPAAFIQATTATVLHPENETRLLFIQVDESASHTREIMERQAQQAAGTAVSPIAPSFSDWPTFIRSLATLRVTIPFAPKLVPFFPDVKVRSRRDFPKLLCLIETSAFLHQHRRASSAGEIVAEHQDYIVAKRLFEHSYAIGPDRAVMELLTAAQNLQAKSNNDFSVADLMKVTGWGKTKTYDLLGRTEDLGCIAEVSRGRYCFLRACPVPVLALPDVLP
jgi:hypothetical protein